MVEESVFAQMIGDVGGLKANVETVQKDVAGIKTDMAGMRSEFTMQLTAHSESSKSNFQKLDEKLDTITATLNVQHGRRLGRQDIKRMIWAALTLAVSGGLAWFSGGCAWVAKHFHG